MNKSIIGLTALLPLLSLTACGPNRTAADAMITNACVAALKVVYESNDTIDVKKTSFTSTKTPEGVKIRTVSIHAYYTHGGGIVEEKDYTCAFEETNSVFGYSVKFRSMDREGTLYGNIDGDVQGDLQLMININQAVVAITGN